MRRSPVYEAAQSLIDEVAEAARKVAAWSPEKRERVRLEGGAMSASAYLAKVEADPRRAAALQRARERAAGVEGTKNG